MGNIGNDMVDGLMCSCGVYFVKAHGYPVLCRTCWQDWIPKERKEHGVQCATERQI